MRGARLLILLAATLTGLAAKAETPAANDYTRAEAWLCRPGSAGPCAAALSATVVPVSGAPMRIDLTPAANPPIDCFYVYPTVSRDPSPNSDIVAGAEENGAARIQFAAFGQVCRLFAPLYRQTTVATLDAGGPRGDASLAYRDVLDAWNEYLAHDNHGRGVVLIGHSQGSSLLTMLIRDAIDGTPAEARLVSALLPGTVIGVPTGKDTGGTFRTVPLCSAATDLGCVVAYSTFRAAKPPTDAGYFGKSPAPGLSAACVNPAALVHGKGAALGAEMPVTPRVAADLHLDTTFIALPDLLHGDCVTDGDLTYLAVSVGNDRRGPLEERALEAAEARAGWGLHSLDVNLVLDDLIALVRAESAAYVAAHPAP